MGPGLESRWTANSRGTFGKSFPLSGLQRNLV